MCEIEQPFIILIDSESDFEFKLVCPPVRKMLRYLNEIWYTDMFWITISSTPRMTPHNVVIEWYGVFNSRFVVVFLLVNCYICARAC